VAILRTIAPNSRRGRRRQLAATRVSFYPEAFGGGQVFTPDGIVARILPDKADHPLLVGEFVDLAGQSATR
jgi:hypothetical protein